MISHPEYRVLEILSDLRERLSSGIVSRPQFQESMGMLRDAILILERKKAGCLQGLHFTPCSCTERGRSLTFTYRKGKIRKKEVV